MPSKSSSRSNEFINKKTALHYHFVRRPVHDPLYIFDDPSTHFELLLANDTKHVNQTDNKEKKEKKKKKQKNSSFLTTPKLETHSQSFCFEKNLNPSEKEFLKEQELWVEETDIIMEEEDREKYSVLDMRKSEMWIDSASEFTDVHESYSIDTSDSELELESESVSESDKNYDYSKHYKFTSHPDVDSSFSSIDAQFSDEIKSLYTALENSDTEEMDYDEHGDEFLDALIQSNQTTKTNKKVSFQLPPNSSSSSILPSSLESFTTEQPDYVPPNVIDVKLKPLKKPWYRGVAQFDEIRQELKDVPILYTSESEEEEEEEEEEKTKEGVNTRIEEKKKKKKVPMERIVCPKEKVEWDGVSILSSSTHSNHRPKLLHFPVHSKKKQKQKENMVPLSIQEKFKTLSLLPTINTETIDQKCNDDGTLHQNYEKKIHLVGVSYPQGPPSLSAASKEEKKEWKKMVKENRRELRQSKKALKSELLVKNKK
ncbi:hypothetical protein HMI54_008338 [Coelomomyces lativittatus]|nr:hypothetical protein HMI54_008338 [Coelomomyces lativittatus]KAJ1510585.1 hypothetical protein HMI56_006273 [Coelomomyces lativittatus]KAJ1511777.1 hypothetical protein HMI55_006471 [Coelomomyces lativittatus]